MTLTEDLYPLGGMKIVQDENMVDTYTETVTFPGHPFIQWLAKYIKFDPNVTAVYVRHRPKKEVIKWNSTLIMHPTMIQSIISDTMV